MKSFSSSLLQFLAARQPCFIADLFAITLVNGQTIYATDGQVDIVSGGQTYYAGRYGGWYRGAFTSGLGPQSSTMDLSCYIYSEQAAICPGTSNVTIRQGAVSGLFDGALVLVSTAYMPTYGDLSLGLEKKFAGEITKVAKLGRTALTFTVADLRYRLNQQCPRNIIWSSCRHTLYDLDGRVGCTLVAATYAEGFSVAAGSSGVIVNMSAATTYAVPWYSQGFLRFTSGNNAGLSIAIAAQLSTTQLQLSAPPMFAPSVGDTFDIYPGCDKTMATCENKFSNLINYGGMPYVPIPETVIS